jgi:hypothetical protein
VSAFVISEHFVSLFLCVHPMLHACIVIVFMLRDFYICTFLCQICKQGKDSELHMSFVKHTIHFLECMYDPYFVWRKRLQG